VDPPLHRHQQPARQLLKTWPRGRNPRHGGDGLPRLPRDADLSRNHRPQSPPATCPRDREDGEAWRCNAAVTLGSLSERCDGRRRARRRCRDAPDCTPGEALFGRGGADRNRFENQPDISCTRRRRGCIVSPISDFESAGPVVPMQFPRTRQPRGGSHDCWCGPDRGGARPSRRHLPVHSRTRTTEASAQQPGAVPFAHCHHHGWTGGPHDTDRTARSPGHDARALPGRGDCRWSSWPPFPSALGAS
jgi:hypothetical protein